MGIFFLWLAFRKVHLDVVWDSMKKANYFWVVFSLAFGVISHVSRAIRWNMMIRTLGFQKTKTSTTFFAVMIGYLANMAIPRMGEVARCGVVSRQYNLPLNKILGTVVSERVLDMIVLLIMIFLVVIFQLNTLGSFVNDRIFSPLFSKYSENQLITFGIILGAILIFSLFYLIKYLIPKIKTEERYKKVYEIIKGFADGIRSIRKVKNIFWFLFHTLFIWLMYFMMTYVIFFAFDVTSGLSVIDGLTVLAIGSLGMVAPVPGGVGAYHFIVTALLFELYQIPKDAAASYATLVHSSQTIMILIVGIISYIAIFFMTKRVQKSTIDNKEVIKTEKS